MLCRGTEIIEVKYQDGTKKRRGAKKAPRAPGRFLVILKSAGTILNYLPALFSIWKYIHLHFLYTKKRRNNFEAFPGAF